jgi:WD40 repeat protein
VQQHLAVHTLRQHRCHRVRLADYSRLQQAITCCAVTHLQVFDAGSRSVLRQFKGHARPCQVVRWSPDKLHLLSGSDDVTLRWWDITQGTQLARWGALRLCG